MNSDNQTDATDSSAPSTVITVIDEDWSFTSEDLSDSSSDEADIDLRSELMNACDEVEKKMKRKLMGQMKGIMKSLREEVEKKQKEAMEKDRKLELLENEILLLKDDGEKKDELIEKLKREIKEMEDSRNELSKRSAKQNEEAEDKIRILSQQNDEHENFKNTFNAIQEESSKLEKEKKELEQKENLQIMKRKILQMKMNSKDGPTAAKRSQRSDFD